MATQKLEIILEAKDRASKVLSGVGSGLGHLGTIAGLGVAGLGALGAATGLAGAKLISLGADAEEMQSKFNVVFGDLATNVTQQLDTFGNAAGRNTFELQRMASTFGDTLQPLGFTQDAAAGLSVDMVKLATDLSSFNNIEMDEALRRLQGTLVGSHENALAFGVVINENTLKAELAAQGWNDLTGAALEQAKVQARINLLMDGTTAAQGDAIRTSGSWTNQMRALKSELSEAATAMGVELLPVLAPLLKDFLAMARDLLPLMVSRFKEFAGELGATVGPAMLVINDALSRIGLALGITSEEVSGFDVVMGALGGVLDAIVISVQATAVAMNLLAGAVEAVVGWAGSAKSAWEGLQGAFSSFSLPDILTPGSPTPLELALWGVSGAMDAIIGKQFMIDTPDVATPELAAPETDALRTIGDETQMIGEGIRATFETVLPYISEARAELEQTPPPLQTMLTLTTALNAELARMAGLVEAVGARARNTAEQMSQAGLPTFGNIDARAQLGRTSL